MGWMILGLSILGTAGCLVGLIVSGKVFARQRRELLEKLEEE